MASHYGITDHFGNLVVKVCECLLRKGSLTLRNVVRFTELPSSQVKNTLLVLVQHTCVQAFIVEDPDETQYLVVFDNILHRMRFSKFLMIATNELDKNCVELLEGLLEHKRLMIQQMFDKAKSKQKAGNEVTLESLRKTLLKLLTCHYVERCPAPEPTFSSEPKEEAPKKRGPKSKIVEEVKTMEQRVVDLAMPSELLRFAINPGGEEMDENNSANVHTGQKHKHDALEPEEESMVLWRASFEGFMRRLRHKVCIEKVKPCIDEGATTVLSAMLEATRVEEKKLKQEYSVPLPAGIIYEEVIKNEVGQKLTFDHVRASLGLLESASFVRVINESYSINLKDIMELAQNDEVESIVLKSYGEIAGAMFRLVSRNGRIRFWLKLSSIRTHPRFCISCGRTTICT